MDREIQPSMKGMKKGRASDIDDLHEEMVTAEGDIGAT